MLALLATLLLSAPSFAEAPAVTTTAAVPHVETALRTSGQPTVEDLQRHASEGVRTVVDLRGVDESRGMDEAAVVAGLNMTYVALPVEGAAGVTVDRARELSALLAQAEGPVLVHCKSSNRVGALLALEAAYVDGEDATTALAKGQAAGLRSLEPLVKELLEQR